MVFTVPGIQNALSSTALLLSAGPGVLPVAQDSEPLDFSIGSVRTVAEAAAVRYAVELAKDIPGIFQANLGTGLRNGSLLDLSPTFKIETGTNDAFNGIVAKLEGHYLYSLRVNDIGGVLVPDATSFNVVPLSIGFETDHKFQNVNALAEIGFVPFSKISPTMLLGANPRVGLFVQAGQKFGVSSGGDLPVGGARDQSQESSGDALLRLKLAFAMNRQIGAISSGKPLSIHLHSDGWFDAANDATYHRLQATFRITVAPDRFFDITYQNGSGAPNFNQGSQFGAHMTIRF